MKKSKIFRNLAVFILVFGTFLITSNTFALSTTVNATGGADGTTQSASAEARLTARIAKGKERAEQELDRRIKALNALNVRINKLVRLSADQKASLSSGIQSQISILNDLKTKISTDTDIDTLKTDIKSITQSYRIFMLIIPQGHIVSMADVINTTADMITAFGVKLQERITLAQNAGKDTTALTALLTDLNSKTADAKTQAGLAVSLTANLKPDNSDQTVMKSNNNALSSAREDLKTARLDLQTAREDGRKIIVGLKAMKISGAATTTVQ